MKWGGGTTGTAIMGQLGSEASQKQGVEKIQGGRHENAADQPAQCMFQKGNCRNNSGSSRGQASTHC